MNQQIKKLRDRQNLRMFSRKEKIFVHIQLNKKENFICWQRFVSKDKRNWQEWNSALSLKDCWQILKKLSNENNR